MTLPQPKPLLPHWWRSMEMGVLRTILVVLVAIIGLDILFGLLGASASDPVGQRLEQVLDGLPERIRSLLSEACLIGTIWYLGQLAQKNELVAMRSLGISNLRICLKATLPTLLLTTVVTIGSEYLTDESHLAEQHLRLQQYQWLPEERLLIHSKTCGEPMSWWRFTTDEASTLTRWGHASSGCYQNTLWHLQNATVWEANTADSTGPVLQPQTQLASPHQRIASHQYEPSRMRIRTLFQQVQQLSPSRYREKIELELFRRLILPLKISLLILLVSLIPLGMSRDSTAGSRLMLALGLALAFHLLEVLLLVVGKSISLPTVIIALLYPMVLMLCYRLLSRRY